MALDDPTHVIGFESHREAADYVDITQALLGARKRTGKSVRVEGRDYVVRADADAGNRSAGDIAVSSAAAANLTVAEEEHLYRDTLKAGK